MSALRHVVGKLRRWLVSRMVLARYKRAGVGRPFLLTDTPEHGNIGDQAIALAEQRLLDRWFGRGSYFEATANQVDGFEKAFARLSPMNQVILVHGGGFLGELWPNEEHRFRRILEAFSDPRVMVFPQTVTFDLESEEGRAFFEESARAYISHPDLTICCRERRSFAFVRDHFPGAKAELVPDVVLSLNVPRADAERDCVLLCMRGDKERVLDDGQAVSLMTAVEGAYPGLPVRKIDTVVPRSITIGGREQEVSNKLREFSHARLVVTDRLHGMVFAAITGTPCVALNNSNGKVGAVYEWISDVPYIAFARSVDEAIAAIKSGQLKPRQYPYERFLSLLNPVRCWLENAQSSDRASSVS